MSFNIMSLFVEQPASDNKESNIVSAPAQAVPASINSAPVKVSEPANVSASLNMRLILSLVILKLIKQKFLKNWFDNL